MSKKGVLLIQDKNYDGKIPKRTMEEIISQFKLQYGNYKGNPNRKIVGFMINGGIDLTKGAKVLFDEFYQWCKSREMFVMYNNIFEITVIRNRLRERVSIDTETINIEFNLRV